MFSRAGCRPLRCPRRAGHAQRLVAPGLLRRPRPRVRYATRRPSQRPTKVTGLAQRRTRARSPLSHDAPPCRGTRASCSVSLSADVAGVAACRRRRSPPAPWHRAAARLRRRRPRRRCTSAAGGLRSSDRPLAPTTPTRRRRRLTARRGRRYRRARPVDGSAASGCPANAVRRRPAPDAPRVRVPAAPATPGGPAPSRPRASGRGSPPAPAAAAGVTGPRWGVGVLTCGGVWRRVARSGS